VRSGAGCQVGSLSLREYCAFSPRYRRKELVTDAGVTQNSQ